MTFLRISKGYDIRIEGRPSSELAVLDDPARVALIPERIPFVKPRLTVETGDAVKIGSVLFVDKRNPDIKFLSPGGGTIEEITFGPRRVIEKIVVQLDGTETSEVFGAVSRAELAGMQRTELIGKIMDGGLWHLFRQLPFRDIADPEEDAPGILVSLDAAEPFSARPEVYLAGRSDLFVLGIRVLRVLAGDRVTVAAPKALSLPDEGVDSLITHRYEGCYPAGDPGVLLYHTKKAAAENRAWYVDGQDVLRLALLLETGLYPTERIVAVAGDLVGARRHVRTRLGVPISHILGASKVEGSGDPRPIVGGILTGYAGDMASYLGCYGSSLTLIAEGEQREFLGFVRPGFRRPSYSRAFLSSLSRSEFRMDCNVHGDVRACIACGSCNGICPVDMLPQLAYKAVLADDVDEFLGHGLLDCVECGLCSYVCPSKIELTAMLKQAKATYYLEQMR